MNTVQWPSYTKFSLGYRFEKEKEAVALVFVQYFIALLFFIVVILIHVQEEMLPVTYRYHAMVVMGLLSLILLRIRWIGLVKVITLTVPPVLLLLIPPICGLVEDEFFFWFPYVPIALSLIPHFILHPIRNRRSLIIIILFYFTLVLMIDNLLIYFSQPGVQMVEIVLANNFYYNLIPVFIFAFVNLGLGLLFRQNARYEEIMKTQQQELAQAEKMASLGTLAAGIAHEINNPLNFISGSLHALNTLKGEFLKVQEYILPEQQQLLKQIEEIMQNSFEGVHRASEIISSLKFFASPVRDEKRVQDLEKLLYPVLLDCQSRVPENTRLVKKIEPGLSVRCFEEPLQQAFANILDNAIEAIESKEERENELIELVAVKDTKSRLPLAHVTISNSGPLIPEDELRQVFDPFFTSKETGMGSGLGMTISYLIIGEHQGTIKIRNMESGVVVDIFLPLGVV
jgi:signal transduction histidine kinase